MKSIFEIDKNLKVETNIQRDGIVFYDAKCPPFDLCGVFYTNGKYRRMPESIAKSVSEGVYWLHSNTAGGRIRFKTNSPYVAINAKMPSVGKMPHFALCGSCGFDLYADGKYFATFMPPFDILNGYESVIDFGDSRLREITINFPLYSEVSELYVGLSNSADTTPPSPYKIDKPLVFYGSSITQGGCASRPGNSYCAMVSEALGADHINLGFSGNAKGEKEISDYICSLKMSAFIFDYDHNAPTPKHLQSTHQRMFDEVRASHPNLPIVLMSRPKCRLRDEEKKNLEIIKATYENAKAKGDKNVYFISGSELMQLCGDEGTVDACHPNDWGFASMAQSVLKILKEFL